MVGLVRCPLLGALFVSPVSSAGAVTGPVLLALVAAAALAPAAGAYPERAVTPVQTAAIRFEPVPLASGDHLYRARLGSAAAATATTGAFQLDLRSGERVELRFAGARRGARPEPREPLAARLHVLRGTDPSQWRRNVPLFGRVAYAQLWPGIDLLFYGCDGRLEHDFVVAPGGDPAAIALEVRGGGIPRLDEAGDLLVPTREGALRLTHPRAYQTVEGRRHEVPVRFALRAGDRVGVEVGSYDRSLPLVVDPVLVFSSVFGGSLSDEVHGVAFGPDGSVFAAGRTESPDFQTTPGAFATELNFCSSTYCTSDAFVMKFDPAGNLVWATYLGGSNSEGALGLAVDGEGHAYVAGTTTSTDFPTTPGAYHESCVGIVPGGTCQGAFATKLDPSGSSLAWSTYVGSPFDSDGPGFDEGGPIAVDDTGHVFLAGSTASRVFPTSPGAFQPVFAGARDAWAMKLAPDGGSAIWATYLGGAGYEETFALAIDPSGAVYVGGRTDSPSLPGASGFRPTPLGGGDGWVIKLSPSGASAIYASYLGGGYTDAILGLAADAQGYAVATGQTKSDDFPLVNAVQGPNIWTTTAGDAFVTRIVPDGAALVYSTLLGGQSFDNGWAVDIAADGAAFVAGTTIGTAEFPVTPDAFQLQPGFNDDAFLAVLGPQGDLRYATFFGGSTNEEGFSVAQGPGNRVALGGMTTSSDFPLLNSIKQVPQPFDGYAAVLDIGAPVRRLTVKRGGTGYGTVTATPRGIDCGTRCISNYDLAAKVSLEATPDAISKFVGWSGACTGVTGPCEIVVDKDQTVFASFVPEPASVLAGLAAAGALAVCARQQAAHRLPDRRGH